MFISSFFSKMGYVRQEPGLVLLSIDDVEVIDEALQIYQARLPTQRYGRFFEAADAARRKVKAVEPGLFRKYLNC
ncbi:hypothetical protein EGT81_19230 [Alcaligenes faecalis]|uniref:hypothetical protein n=1 Tax=Alcaligenes faecalis TaxID=511 RepID=UPI000F690257|nr:hypothetical protein [Alcaligenes faecalis]RSE57572.1 hypothetical protein EGT81_19230 [Alcaligenes faecalis]